MWAGAGALRLRTARAGRGVPRRRPDIAHVRGRLLNREHPTEHVNHSPGVSAPRPPSGVRRRGSSEAAAAAHQAPPRVGHDRSPHWHGTTLVPTQARHDATSAGRQKGANTSPQLGYNLGKLGWARGTLGARARTHSSPHSTAPVAEPRERRVDPTVPHGATRGAWPSDGHASPGAVVSTCMQEPTRNGLQRSHTRSMAMRLWGER